MTYYVTTQGRNNVTLFLVNRRITKKSWWTVDLIDAMEFNKHSAAIIQCNKLRYKSPCVVDSKEAHRLCGYNDHVMAEIGEHPFSSEALGQE